MERNHIFPNRAKQEFLFFRMVAGSGCYLNSCVFLIIHLVHVIHGAQVGVMTTFKCKIFTPFHLVPPAFPLAANPMESTAEKTSCLLGVLHHEDVRQWFEHDNSVQMVARLSLVSSAGSWGKKVGDVFCCFQIW